MKKLKVALVLEGVSDIGGGFQQQLAVVQSLCDDLRFEKSVVVLNEDSLNQLCDLKIDKFYFRENFFSKLLGLLIRWKAIPEPVRRKLRILTKFEKFIIDKGFDLIYFLSPNYYALEIKELNFIFTVWDLNHRLQPEFPEVYKSGEFELREKIYKEATVKAIANIVDSELGGQQLNKFYNVNLSRIFSQPFHPSVAIFEQGFTDVKLKFNLKKSFIFYPAQFWPHKNHVYILNALSILKSKHNIEVDLVLCGSDKGNLNYVKKFSRLVGVEAQVKFLGFVSNLELKLLYKNCLALVMPTYFGPTNMPPIEAFILETPVIYSQHLAEQVGNGALLCDLNDPESLVTELMKLINDPNENFRNQLIQLGKNQYQKMNVNKLDLYDQVLKPYHAKLLTWNT